MMAIKSARQSASPADARCSADQSGIGLHPTSAQLQPAPKDGHCVRIVRAGIPRTIRRLHRIEALVARGGRVARSMVCSGVNFRALASFTGRHQLGHVVRIDHEFLGRSVMEDLICLDCPLQRDHLGV